MGTCVACIQKGVCTRVTCIYQVLTQVYIQGAHDSLAGVKSNVCECV